RQGPSKASEHGSSPLPGSSPSRGPDPSGLGGSWQAFDRVQGTLHLALVQGDILELAREVVVVGRHIEVAVAGKVEQDGALLARLVGRLRNLQRPVNGVRGLRRRENSLASREEHGRGE